MLFLCPCAALRAMATDRDCELRTYLLLETLQVSLRHLKMSLVSAFQVGLDSWQLPMAALSLLRHSGGAISAA